MGRHPISDQPMTPAERQARSRAMQRQHYIESYPESIARRVTRVLYALDGVNVAATDKALALIARDIAKRRKALAPALAEHRRKQRALRRFMRGGHEAA